MWGSRSLVSFFSLCSQTSGCVLVMKMAPYCPPPALGYARTRLGLPLVTQTAEVVCKEILCFFVTYYSKGVYNLHYTPVCLYSWGCGGCLWYHYPINNHFYPHIPMSIHPLPLILHCCSRVTSILVIYSGGTFTQIKCSKCQVLSTYILPKSHQ